MLDQVLNLFEIKADVDLNIMKPNQSLSGLIASAIKTLDFYFNDFSPELVLLQGDTTTVFAGALVAFYHKVKIGHIEAGLRTWNKFSPFPEEINRVLTTKLADYYFTPTKMAKDNLIKEGINAKNIFITGNTVIDALSNGKGKNFKKMVKISNLPRSIFNDDNKTLVLITGHRRENFGEGFKNICKAIARFADEYKDILFVYPVHLNPNVRKMFLKCFPIMKIFF